MKQRKWLVNFEVTAHTEAEAISNFLLWLERKMETVEGKVDLAESAMVDGLPEPEETVINNRRVTSPEMAQIKREADGFFNNYVPDQRDAECMETMYSEEECG